MPGCLILRGKQQRLILMKQLEKNPENFQLRLRGRQSSTVLYGAFVFNFCQTAALTQCKDRPLNSAVSALQMRPCKAEWEERPRRNEDDIGITVVMLISHMMFVGKFNNPYIDHNNVLGCLRLLVTAFDRITLKRCSNSSIMRQLYWQFPQDAQTQSVM